MALAQATQLLEKFKAAYNKNDLETARSTLDQLKLKMIELPALPPSSGPSATAQQELMLARDALEHGVLLSLKLRDDGAMERSFTQLKALYADTRKALPPSPKEPSMQGLNLLRLLVQNRIAEFHTELELIGPAAQADANITLAIQLEQWLMEGAYNKVIAAGQQLPSEFHSFFMDQLAATVRDEIASCSEKAYAGGLSVADAQRLLMFRSPQEVTAYAEKLGWRVVDGQIVFPGAGEDKAAAAAAAAASGGGKGGAATAATAVLGESGLTLIKNTLVYAKELERIV